MLIAGIYAASPACIRPIIIYAYLRLASPSSQLPGCSPLVAVCLHISDFMRSLRTWRSSASSSLRSHKIEICHAAITRPGAFGMGRPLRHGRRPAHPCRAHKCGYVSGPPRYCFILAAVASSLTQNNVLSATPL